MSLERVEILVPGAYPDEPERDPRSDFGRVVRGTPSQVFRPADVAALARTLSHLAARRLPYRLRGGGWSSGGQVVTDGGAVVDLTRLDRIIEDRPGEDEISVEGGATWLAVATLLRETGRRPLIVPENPKMTVGGSLAAGDLGDTSAVHGLCINQVKRLTLVTPDGEIRRLGPGDELFRFALGGSGMTGAIAEATLKTVRRPPTVVSRTLVWLNIDAYCADAPLNSDLRLYEIMSGALTWREGSPMVYAMAGNFMDRPIPDEPGLWDLGPSAVGVPETADRLKTLSTRKVAWDRYRPAMQVAVPIDRAPEVLHKLADYISSETSFRSSLPGVGVLVFKTDPRFPMAPQPDTPLALALLLRPQVEDRAVVDKLLPYLRTVGLRALEIGGRVTQTSIAVGLPDFARWQLGAALGELVRLRSAVDPHGLCNRGVMEGFGEGLEPA